MKPPRTCPPCGRRAGDRHRRLARHRHRPGAGAQAAGDRLSAARRIPAVELQRLDAALDKVFAEIGTLIAQSRVASIRDIFTTHRAMLRDPALREEVQVRLQKGLKRRGGLDGGNRKRGAAAGERCMTSCSPSVRPDLRDVGRRVLASPPVSKLSRPRMSPTFW